MSEQTLTCHDVVEIITDYLEDALSPAERLRVENHLRACPGCTNYLEQMREMIRLTGMVNEDELPEEQRQQLQDAFRTWAVETD
jgi:anti-sigma factor RsiW